MADKPCELEAARLLVLAEVFCNVYPLAHVCASSSRRCWRVFVGGCCEVGGGAIAVSSTQSGVSRCQKLLVLQVRLKNSVRRTN